MLQIPQYVLENLKCAVCDGYLSSKPLVIKPEGEQVCGKCFRIIPTEEKEKCVREVGLETLAQLFIFPCRYNRQGCNYTFAWGNESNHEEICQYRYTSTPRNSYESVYCNFRQAPKQDFKSDSEDVKTRFSCELKDRNYGKPLPIRNGSASELQNYINFSIEGAVSLKPKPELVYSDIKLNRSPEESLYESLTSKRALEKHCSTCNITVEDDVYSCIFGHVTCANCKTSMCKKCVNQLEKESKTICRNYQKGCKNIFRQSEIYKHESNCQYNDLKCPFESCKFKSVLSNLKVHLKEAHPEKVYLTNETTKTFQNKDDTIVFFCYESVFKCVYFYYKSFVEFFVTYIGPSEEAVEYTYELSAQSNGNSLATRRSKCSSWNDSMLERGITFEKKELVNNNEKKLNFEIRLRILHIK